jgi:hypothetical protein
MYNTFRRGFSSSGFFTKSFFNNKYHFNMFNSKVNQNVFRINFANKSFLTRILHLNGSYSLLAKLTNNQQIAGSIGCNKDVMERENSDLQLDINDGLVLMGELFFFRDDCKWACGTRLVSGPLSPVLALTTNKIS